MPTTFEREQRRHDNLLPEDLDPKPSPEKIQAEQKRRKELADNAGDAIGYLLAVNKEFGFLSEKQVKALEQIDEGYIAATLTKDFESWAECEFPFEASVY
jgi:hypothetical protein